LTIETLEKLEKAVRDQSNAIMHECGSYDASDNTWTCAGERGAFIEGLDEAHNLISNALAKIKPVLSTDCRNKDHRFCEGEESALWPDGETTIRKCSCSCHPSPKATDAKSAAEQERDDALFALQALCEEVNAMKTGHTYTLADCIQGAVDYREYNPFPESGNEERNG
jgi:hypothetical protein